MFNYDPKDASTCWPEGGYDATINSYEEGQSKSSGADMLTIEFEVYSGSQTMRLKEYIVTPSTVFKLKKIAVALGERAKFEKGQFNIAEHLGASIRLNLEVEENEDFGDRNVIRGYAKHEGDKPARSTEPAKQSGGGGGHAAIDDGDIPFDY